MTRPLAGRTIALAEGRQLEELAQMLEKEGATALRCPMVSILDAPDRTPVVRWLHGLSAGEMHYLILMTGEAWRRLLDVAEQEGLKDAVVAAAERTRIVTRGPKPVRALKDVGLTPTLVAEAPTTEGVIATLRKQDLRGQVVGLTLYGGPNPTLEHFLSEAGATVRPVLSYVYAPAADADRVIELIRRLAGGSVDVLIFTSSPQLERLFEVAAEHGLADVLRQGLERTRVAAVGPVMAETLHHKGVRVDIQPEQGFVLKNLVNLIRRQLGASGEGGG